VQKFIILRRIQQLVHKFGGCTSQECKGSSEEQKHDCNEYYGFGLGATGYVNQIRNENTRNISKYIKGEYRLNELIVSTQEEMENEIILGLRKLKGISIRNFSKKFNKNIKEEFNIEHAIKDGLLIEENGYLYIKEDKIYVMNEIINMII